MCTLEKIKQQCRNFDELEPDDCFEWTGHAQRGKFPRAWVDGRLVYLRRYVYELAFEVIQPKRVISMRCGNDLCLNPEHMAAKSVQQALRARAKQGTCLNEAYRLKIARTRQERSRLTQEAVDAIRAGGKITEHAANFGVSVSYAYKIRNYETWKPLNVNPFGGLFMGLLRQPEPA